MDAQIAIAKIKVKIGQITELRSQPRFCPQFKKWHRETIVLLQRIFGPDTYPVSDFRAVQFLYRGGHAAGDQKPFERRYRSAIDEAEATKCRRSASEQPVHTALLIASFPQPTSFGTALIAEALQRRFPAH
jgi:hypothetical protein